MKIFIGILLSDFHVKFFEFYMEIDYHIVYNMKKCRYGSSVER